jgi:flagella synthesis protein FlgN
MQVQQAIATLRTVVRAEVEGHRALLDVLAVEQRALREGDAEAVIAAAGTKQKHVRELEALARQRIELFLAAGISIQPTGLDVGPVPPALAHGLRDDWSQLIKVAAEAQRVNRLNGRLIARHRRHCETALAALMQADGQCAGYKADGQPDRPSAGRALAAA